MSGVPQTLLKLVPANPIFLRIVSAGGRRFRHALTRWIYLALLIGVLLLALLATAADKKSLSDLAKASSQVFMWISYVQLVMICLLAPIFTAGAITQERDSQTYNILLATPLSNAQIVLGTLLSRMYYVVALLFSGVPVFAITLFYGGVTGNSIALSFAIAGSTGLVMGAMAITIAVFRLGTSKTVIWFYVFNAVYLVGLWLVDYQISGVGTGAGHTTWFTGIHPFLALQAVVSPTAYATPDLASLASSSTLIRWYRAYPAHAYVAITLLLSMIMIVPSAIVLRRIAQRSDVGLWQYLRHLVFPNMENRSRKARRVWSNPVAWREAATRAGASARGLTRWATIVAGVAAALALLYLHFNGTIGSVASLRQWLLVLVTVEFSVALLVATNSSASAVTRERESRTLDLLLVTPITSRYYIWGKLRGLVSFMLPFAAVPTLTIFLVLLYDMLITRNFLTDPIVFPETLILLPIFLTAIIAFACMLGLHLSLKWSRTLVAVMGSAGVLVGAASLLGICGAVALKLPYFGLIFGAFSPFTGLCILLDPLNFAAPSFTSSSSSYASGGAIETTPGRVIIFISFLVSGVTYCLLIWGMYRSMVKNFDMIIRRQHQ